MTLRKESRRVDLPSRTPLGGYLPSIAMLALSAVLGVLLFVVPTKELVGLVAVLLMLSLMFAKVPVAFALGIPGLLGLMSLHGGIAFANAASSVPFNSIASWSLTVLPTFILMGILLHASGVTNELYSSARILLAWMPGGLAVATNTAGAGFAAVSGSTIATTHALARIAIPEMIRSGYSPRFAMTSVVSAGLPGQLIPPSTFLVIYAGIASVPVGAQLLAGTLPGLGISVLFSATFVLFAIMRPKAAGSGSMSVAPRYRVPDYLLALGRVWPVPLLMIVVIGGMLSGTMTATEAGAAGALGALFICLWRQRRNGPLRVVLRAAADTAMSVGSIFLLIIGAHMLSNLMSVSGIARVFTDWVTSAGLGPVEFMLMMALIYLIMGMFMDPLSMLLLTVPVVMPILTALELSPLLYGVFAVFMAELAILTPPVGILSFILHRIVQNPAVSEGRRISLGQVFISVLWIMPIALLAIVLLVCFPEVATWLPTLAG
ncbi:TRAP transporter large permease [Microbacterium sp. NPDC077644]|uniref:TRAP transporter large permease n=1 Tax=Microbacterium sp. NPDC077644 TaxID=3155055 RepID=UPI00344B1C79